MTRPLIGLPVSGMAAGLQGHYSLPQAYSRAILDAEGVPLLLPLMDEEPALRQLYDLLDGLLLCGGGDVAAACYGATDSRKLTSVDRQRDWVEITLTRWALEDGMPILGICRGIQTLNVAAGGDLVADIPSEVPGALVHNTAGTTGPDALAHEVAVRSASLLANVLSVETNAKGAALVWVNSTHHQAVKRVAPGLTASAHAPDGVIEAIEASAVGGRFVLGVQWHPERLVPSYVMMACLFQRLVQACAR